MVRLLGVFVLGLALGHSVLSHAEQFPTDDTVAWAATVDPPVDPLDLQGAVNTTRLDPPTYLRAVGLLPPLLPPLNPRVECIIGKESGGLDVYNQQGSGATGPGQYMPGTWASHTREMGMPWLSIHSLPDVRLVAAYDLDHGRRSQWTVGGC